MPNDSGSGGGNGRTTAGGAGGDRILVTASGTVTVDGTLSASGNAAGGHNDGGVGDGEAGGTIRIKANTFSGGGLLWANGDGGGVTHPRCGVAAITAMEAAVRAAESWSAPRTTACLPIKAGVQAEGGAGGSGAGVDGGRGTVPSLRWMPTTTAKVTE